MTRHMTRPQICMENIRNHGRKFLKRIIKYSIFLVSFKLDRKHTTTFLVSVLEFIENNFRKEI